MLLSAEKWTRRSIVSSLTMINNSNNSKQRPCSWKLEIMCNINFFFPLQEGKSHPLLVSAPSFDGQSVSEFYDAAETLLSSQETSDVSGCSIISILLVTFNCMFPTYMY